MPSCIRPYTPWNILNMPAGIVPISKVTEQDDKDMESLPNNDLVSFLLKKSQDACKKRIAWRRDIVMCCCDALKKDKHTRVRLPATSKKCQKNWGKFGKAFKRLSKKFF